MRAKWFAVAPYASSQGGARLNVKVAAWTIRREKTEVGKSSAGSATAQHMEVRVDQSPQQWSELGSLLSALQALLLDSFLC